FFDLGGGHALEPQGLRLWMPGSAARESAAWRSFQGDESAKPLSRSALSARDARKSPGTLIRGNLILIYIETTSGPIIGAQPRALPRAPRGRTRRPGPARCRAPPPA